MDPQNITFVLAFLAGILSFISPCVLPLVPAYIGYLSGRTLSETQPKRAATFVHALLFVMGFTVVFSVIFGLAAGLLSQAFSSSLDLLRRIGGVIVIILGLHVMGVISIPFLQYERRLGMGSNPGQQGYSTSFIVGVSFAAGWTPCVGPILGGIFSMALNEGAAGRSILMFLIYSLGLGVPFLLTALALERLTPRLRRLNRYMGVIEKVSGALLILVGVLLLTNGIFWLARLFQWVPPI